MPIRICSCVTLFVLAAAGESIPPMETDRPSFGVGTSVVAPGVIQAEAGSAWSASATSRSVSIAEQVYRIGVRDGFEFRLWHDGYLRAFSSGAVSSAWRGVAAGAKLRLASELGRRPALALLARWSLGPERDPSLLLAWSRTLRGTFSAAGNVAVSGIMSETGRFAQRAVSCSVTRAAARSSVFAEAYVFNRTHPAGEPVAVLASGWSKRIGSDVQIDASAGRAVLSRHPQWFVAVGIAVRRTGSGWLVRRLLTGS